MKTIRIMFAISVVFLAALAFTVSSQSADPVFKAKLTGNDFVPPIKTPASGECTLQSAKEGEALSFKLSVKDVQNVNGAHVHQGKKGAEGPPVATLFNGPKKQGKFSGTLSEGTISDSDLVGPLQGKSIKDFIQLIRAGNAYVNVHTDAHPNGEIRGQLK